MPDLAMMPHLLIAGSTGTGKSVAIQRHVVERAVSRHADDVRLIMVDPKRLELACMRTFRTC